ncbi:MAG: PolC-type DNA polymerase III [Terriglobia bacterium]
MASRIYKNLIPDSHLHRELESLLRKNGGVATLEEICREVFLLPTASAPLARVLVEELIQGDPRLQWAADTRVECSEPSPEEVWRQRKHVLVVDIETTDGTRRDQRIIELGVCRIEKGCITREWSQLLNPERSVSPWIRNLTGITKAMLAAAPRFAEVADRLLEELEGAILVAHHARFDVAVLSAEVSRLRGQRLGNYYLCTVELARHVFPSMENYRLETLSRTLGLCHERPHRAGSDARATAELFTRLAETSDWALAPYLRPHPLVRRPAAQIVETSHERIS